MRITVASGIVLFLALVAPMVATPAQEPSLLGDWTATARTAGGDVSETLRVVRSGNSFAITAKRVGAGPDGPEAGPGTDIVLDGDTFSYKRSVTTPDGTLVITYSGVVSGDTFTGTVNLGGFAEAPYTGVRIKPSEGKTIRE
jgi:hypothetical protein